jgi:hypothetical protein
VHERFHECGVGERGGNWDGWEGEKEESSGEGHDDARAPVDGAPTQAQSHPSTNCSREENPEKES